MRPVTPVTVACCWLSACGLLFAETERKIDFERRVEAQRAIEEVYYSHQIGVRRAFKDAVPQELLERKVHDYLRKSVALEHYWGIDIGQAELTRELSRISSASRIPQRLEQLYAALDHDTALVVETLVRPVLVDRLAREAFAADGAIPDDIGWDEWWAENAASFNDRLVRPIERLTEELPRPVERTAVSGGFDPACNGDWVWDNGILEAGEFDPLRYASSSASVWTGSQMIIWGGFEYEDSGQIYDPTLDRWTYTSRIGAPAGRSQALAVWTGQEMIVYGGHVGAERLTSGGRYDPIANSWHPIAEGSHATTDGVAVWTGSEMVVWGGYNGVNVQTGARYDPATDSWSPTSVVDAPEGRSDAVAIRAGSEMIVWGGSDGSQYRDSGGRYDPVADQWTPMSLVNSPAGRELPSVVWTGTEMIVWGGRGQSGGLGDGAAYDPATDQWRALSEVGAPPPIWYPTAVWTGSDVIFWGRVDGEPPPPVWIYDPGTDNWRASTEAPPGFVDVGTSGGPRHFHFWTGTEVLLWLKGDGGLYDPLTDAWRTTDRPDPSPDRAEAVGAVWTGNEYIVWGGNSASTARNTGARYDPLVDQWTPTSTLGAPAPRYEHTAVWSGDEMLIWGGRPFNQGGRYDPVSDSWAAITEVEAAEPRMGHTAVWTGSEMVIWGGRVLENNEPPDTEARCLAWYPRTGASYDPVSDSWRPVRRAVVTGRIMHTAVWAGDRMIVYGGEYPRWIDDGTGVIYCDVIGTNPVGGSYFPGSTAWSAISTVGAPFADILLPSVWTGDRVIIDKHAYFPATDSWDPLPAENAPDSKRLAVLDWTGSAVVQWSGQASSGGSTADGGSYAPATDTWVPLPYAGAPIPGIEYKSAWTGDFMLVWQWNQGGRLYPGNPDADSDGIADACDLCPLDPLDDQDLDGVCHGLDNCPATTNASQADGDGDGTGDACDICPLTSDGSQIDTDGDGAGDACDCQPLDPDDLAPNEVTPLVVNRLDATTLSLSWPVTAGSDLFSIQRGLLSSLTDGAYGSCFAEGLHATTVEDGETPPPGDGYFYLVQGQNAECGLGGLGLSTLGWRVNPTPGACVGGAYTDVFAEGETSIGGAVTGSLVDTTASDGTVETLTEEQTSGNPSTRYDWLEHHWSFSLPSGAVVELHVEGYRTDSADAEIYEFELSTDGGATWVPLGSAALPFVDDPVDRTLLAPAVSGAVLLRVVDSNRDLASAVLDSVSIDQIFFRVFD